MGEAFILNRPFKPLVERSSRSTLTFCLTSLWLLSPQGGVSSSRSTLASLGAGTLAKNGTRGLKTT
jgi:hypothetical protein